MTDHDHRPATPGPPPGRSRHEPVTALGLPRILSDVRLHEQAIARVDGVLNLLRKAERATGAGDRAAALALVEKAERFAPSDPEELPAEHRDGFAAIQDALRAARREALALPE